MHNTWIEGKLKGLHTRTQDLEAEIEELKALDDEGLKKLAKTKEVQALEANMRNLEGQLEYKRGQ
jgi:uncharacterized protein involved in exopolysaccharide biosynthesis